MSRNYRREKELRFLRARGLAGYVPAGPVQEKIRYWHDVQGVPFQAIADRIGRDRKAVIAHYHGVNKKGEPALVCQRSTELIVLSTRFPPGECEWFPAVGIRRRLRALNALGFSASVMGAQCNWDRRILWRCMAGAKARRLVSASNAVDVIRMYDKLIDVDPLDMAGRPEDVTRTRQSAEQNGYAPPSCWDVDTIDDPQAVPQWTGRCGTPMGNYIHVRDGIPLCPPCREAGHMVGVPGFSGKLLREMRERAGWSIRALASHTGVAEQSIIGWELGNQQPQRRARLEVVLSVFDATIEDVCEESDE